MKKTTILFSLVSIILIILALSACSNASLMTMSDDEKVEWFSSQYPGGAELDPSEIRESRGVYSAVTRNGESLPATVDLSEMMPPVGNQGGQGSCTSWAVAYAAKTYYEGIEEGWNLNYSGHQFSPAFLYNQIQAGFVSVVLDKITSQGCETLAAFPYNDKDMETQPDAENLTNALTYKGNSWQYVNKSVEDIKTLLAGGDVVIIVIAIYDDLYTLSPANPVYDDYSGQRHGFHTVTITGYDDATSSFSFINSWGENWGIDGYGAISYDFIKENDPVFKDAYLMIDAANRDDINTRTIYYYTENYLKYIHYQQDSGLWTEVPGVEMVEQPGNWYVQVLEDSGDITFCFNDMFSTWDSNNGYNYNTTLGTVWVKDGQVHDNDPTSSEVTFSFKKEGDGSGYDEGHVTLVEAGTGNSQYVQADADGMVRFTSLTPGEYTVTARVYSGYSFLDGTTSKESTITVSDNDYSTEYRVKYTGGYGNVYFQIDGNPSYFSNPLIGADLTIKKNGSYYKTQEIASFNYGTPWAYLSGLEEGSYTVDLDEIINNKYYSGQLSFTVSEDDNYFSETMVVSEGTIPDPVRGKVIHYYNTAWQSAYIHYQTDSGNWTNLPGAGLASDGNGWFTVSIDDSDSITFCFNNGSGQWDSAGGSNYQTSESEVWIMDGSIFTEQPGDNGSSVTFTATPSNLPAGKVLEVRGGFAQSNWTSGVAMTENGDGSWSVTIEIAEASFEYKYTYVDGGTTIWENMNGNHTGSAPSTLTDSITF
jgi:C1A family cysteine protease